MEKNDETRLALEQVCETLGSVAVTLLCVGGPSKSALRDIRRQVMECIDTIETMMEEQSNDHS